MNESPTLHRCSWLCFIGEIVGRMDGRYPVFFGKRDPGPKSHFKKCAGTVKLHKRTMTFPFFKSPKIVACCDHEQGRDEHRQF